MVADEVLVIRRHSLPLAPAAAAAAAAAKVTAQRGKARFQEK
jgi:hypothetical protein